MNHHPAIKINRTEHAALAAMLLPSLPFLLSQHRSGSTQPDFCAALFNRIVNLVPSRPGSAPDGR